MKRKKNERPKMWELLIWGEIYCEGGDILYDGDRNPDKQDTYETYDYNGVMLPIKDGELYDNSGVVGRLIDSTLANFEPSAGQKVYVVYVDYDTDDSFSRTYGRRSEVMAVATEEEAESLRDAILKSKNDESYSFPWTDLQGITHHISTAQWTGYFEHLRSCEYEEFTIRGPELKRVPGLH